MRTITHLLLLSVALPACALDGADDPATDEAELVRSLAFDDALADTATAPDNLASCYVPPPANVTAPLGSGFTAASPDTAYWFTDEARYGVEAQQTLGREFHMVIQSADPAPTNQTACERGWTSYKITGYLPGQSCWAQGGGGLRWRWIDPPPIGYYNPPPYCDTSMILQSSGPQTSQVIRMFGSAATDAYWNGIKFTLARRVRISYITIDD